MTTAREIVLHDSVVVLTPRQMDVLRAAAQGLNQSETAALLGVGSETIKTHRATIMELTGARNITAACVMAARAGLL